VRIYDLARELGVSNQQIIEVLRELGVEVKSHSSTIDESTAQVVRELIKEQQDKQGTMAKPGKKSVKLPPRPLPAIGDAYEKALLGSVGERNCPLMKR